jgi:Reverse transcriptase (RNA-dependent DNA polymerase)
VPDASEKQYFLKIPRGLKREDGTSLEGLVWRCNTYLYGMKEASYQWMKLLDEFLGKVGFKASEKDKQLYTRIEKNGAVTRIGVHVDDGIITGKFDVIKNFIFELEKKWDITLELEPSIFVGWNIIRDRINKTIYVNQNHYIEHLLEQYGPAPIRTHHVAMEKDFDPTYDANLPLLDENVPYAKLLGSLLHLTQTRVDICYAVSVLAQFRNCAQAKHWNALKRILWYLCTTKHLHLVLGKLSRTALIGFSDASYATETDCKSRTGTIIHYYGSPIYWATSKQQLVAQSTAESEYVALAESTKTMIYCRQLLETLGVPAQEPDLILVDNQAAIELTKTEKINHRTRHIAVRYHAIKDYIAKKIIKVDYVNTLDMLADFLTKKFSRRQFEDFRDRIGLRRIKNDQGSGKLKAGRLDV